MSKVGVYEPNTTENDPMKTLSISDSDIGEGNCEKKVPKRILHFCDGTIEEFSSDEDDEVSIDPYKGELIPANLADLPWVPWFWYQTVCVGTRTLAFCDYLGESLANFFGIISPKYEYEIEQYKRMIAEEEERRKQDIELGGWSKNSLASEGSDPVHTEPQRSLIRSKLDYGCVAYNSASHAVLKTLDTIHNGGLRIATGAFRSSPTNGLLVEAGELPLTMTREILL